MSIIENFTSYIKSLRIFIYNDYGVLLITDRIYQVLKKNSGTLC